MIRESTRGARSIRDVYRALWRDTNQGDLPYGAPEIKAALTRTADLDWDAFFTRYIEGTDRLPIESVLNQAGLRLVSNPDGSAQIEHDPDALPAARSRWAAIASGR